jgi:hypothetical protein
MIRNVTEIRVRYADTDQMKQVYYGKFFEYFEQGRSDLLRNIGLPYPRVAVDHGTALELAGKGIANDGSLWQAVRLCRTLATAGKAA